MHPAAYHASLPLTSRWTARPRPVLAASRPPPAGAPRPPPAGAPPPAPASPALSLRASSTTPRGCSQGPSLVGVMAHPHPRGRRSACLGPHPGVPPYTNEGPPALLRPRVSHSDSPAAPLPPAGTLHPNCQDSSGRPRRDIGTILQILNDLLSATRHYQGMPPSLTQLRCHAQCAPASPAPDLTPKTTSCEKLAAAAPASLSQARTCKPLGK